MTDYLLIHGAFQGGWVWRDVAAGLRSRGHRVHTPTLTGCGHLHHGAREGIDLNTYIQDALNYLQFEDIGDVVLAAHSFSGLVAGAVMTRLPHLIRRAVFVDAVLPEPGRSFAETAGEAFRLMMDTHRVNGWRVKPWPLHVFGVPEARAEWFRNRLCDFPAAAFETPFPGEFDPRAAEAVFVAGRQTTSPFIRAMADKARRFGWPVAELDSGRCPMVSHPEELVEGLLED